MKRARKAVGGGATKVRLLVANPCMHREVDSDSCMLRILDVQTHMLLTADGFPCCVCRRMAFSISMQRRQQTPSDLMVSGPQLVVHHVTASMQKHADAGCADAGAVRCVQRHTHHRPIPLTCLQVSSASVQIWAWTLQTSGCAATGASGVANLFAPPCFRSGRQSMRSRHTQCSMRCMHD